jgi:hypothetical protein
MQLLKLRSGIRRRLRVRTAALSLWLYLSALALLGIVPSAVRAQQLPQGVVLGMSADELRRAVPDVEKVRRPVRMAGGLVGSWCSTPVQVFGLTGQQTFYFAGNRLTRVEFVGNAADASANAEAFNQIIAWGRSLDGPGIYANDAQGSSYAEWGAGDTEIYAQYVGGSGGVRLVYKRKPDRDASQL